MILFWRENEENGFYSNFSGHAIIVHGLEYKTGEHFFQAQKSLDHENHEKVRLTKTPREAKDLARSLPLRSDWEDIKFYVMLEGLRAKVEQHPFIKEKLLSTGDMPIAENSPYDEIWGLGKHGKGFNLLGKAWMQIRAELYAKQQVEDSKK